MRGLSYSYLDIRRYYISVCRCLCYSHYCETDFKLVSRSDDKILIYLLLL
jgi:hypothetical protein